MAVSQHALRDFRQDDERHRPIVIDAVQEAGFTINYIREVRGKRHSWGLLLKPNENLGKLFRIDRDVVLWVTTFPTFEPRDIDDMKAYIDEMDRRINSTFSILLTAYSAEPRITSEAEETLGTPIVHCSFTELVELSEQPPGSFPLFVSMLISHLYTRDLYDLPSATTRNAEFFGRRRTLDNVAGEITRGQVQIGIFGLRKIGKTSLINRVIDALLQSGRCFVAKVDLQWTTSIDSRPEYTLWAIGEAIHVSGRGPRSTKGLMLFGQFGTASEATRAGISIWEAFAHDLRLVIKGTSRRIVIVMDEIERLYELNDEGGFVRIWRVLRGFDQQYPNRLRYLVSGTTPECAESPVVAGRDNPLYQYLSVHYLEPLDRTDTDDLLKSLGEQIGLQWTDAALSYAFEQTGGHPALVRTLGSVVHSTLLPRNATQNVSRAISREAALRILSAKPAVLAQVTASLSDRYEDEFVMLDMLAQGEVYNFRQLAVEYPNELSHLIGYGLLPNGVQSDRLSVGLLQSHLQKRNEISLQRRGSIQSLVSIGEFVGVWEIVASLSSGGFADVYIALDKESGSKVAVKVFRGAKLSSLEREVESLQTLKHPGIVQFIEATQATSNAPCLVMEYVEGKTLADYCIATNSLDTYELVLIADKLLLALEYMHPNQVVLDSLSSKEQLSADEFETWERAKHGIIHRDIKPENIILSSGDRPVLIDFNIASRAADPVITVSATPGYLPGFNGVTWTPGIDIFQLGVTLAQVGAAVKFDGKNIDDLMELASRRHGSQVEEWIRELLRGEEGPTASAARASLRGVAHRMSSRT